MNDLIEAVHALTEPTRTKVIQGDVVTEIEHDALLEQLRSAITSALGNGGGGGTKTGAVLNDEAFYRFSIIAAQIGDWCRLQSVRPSRDPVKDLKAWMVAFTGTPDWYVRQLHSWARTIVEVLDPPKRVPLSGPCVACGARNQVNADGGLSPAVVVEYDQVVLHPSLRAVCRVCELSWDGPDAVAELVEEMKDRDPKTTVSGKDER